MIPKEQLVLAFVFRTAIADCFRTTNRPTMRACNLIVDRNIEAFARIVRAKYERGEASVYQGFGQNFPRVDVTLEDMQRSGKTFTSDVVKAEAAFRWTA
jgi:hypothetical protein